MILGKGNSLLSIVKNETLAFMLKPQEGCKKHVLFRTFWNKLKLVDDFQVILEIQLNNKKWKAYKKWRGHLCQTDYDLYICGGGVIPMTVEKNERWIIRKWHQYMLHKIKTKYDAEVNMKKIVVSPSVSKW